VQRPSYDELASLVAALIARVEALELENSALKRKLGTDSTNSSAPPSQDSLAAKGKRRAERSQRMRSKDRKPGGQRGRKGSGLTPAAAPDRRSD
jgi:transposase